MMDEMNQSQRDAVHLALAGHSLFITGGIGTGKTRTLQYIVTELRKRNLQVDVTASTGLASKQIQGICN